MTMNLLHPHTRQPLPDSPNWVHGLEIVDEDLAEARVARTLVAIDDQPYVLEVVEHRGSLGLCDWAVHLTDHEAEMHRTDYPDLGDGFIRFTPLGIGPVASGERTPNAAQAAFDAAFAHHGSGKGAVTLATAADFAEAHA